MGVADQRLGNPWDKGSDQVQTQPMAAEGVEGLGEGEEYLTC